MGLFLGDDVRKVRNGLLVILDGLLDGLRDGLREGLALVPIHKRR